MKAVVRAWTANLNAENNAAEARLFSLPALIDVGLGCWCLTRADIAHFHAQIRCSLKIVSIKVRRRYATAVFGVGDRETSKCSSAPGPDTTGSRIGMRFTIVRGKISGIQALWWKPPGRGRLPARLPAIRAPGR